VFSSFGASAATKSFIAAIFLLGMLRQMAGVIASQEAGIGLLARLACKHPDFECVSPGFVDAILGVSEADSGE